jgi:hypothetical protein
MEIEKEISCQTLFVYFYRKFNNHLQSKYNKWRSLLTKKSSARDCLQGRPLHMFCVDMRMRKGVGQQESQ